MLVTLIFAAVVAALFGWSVSGANGKTVIAVIGNVSAGLPAPHIPAIKFWWVKELSSTAFSALFISVEFAILIGVALSIVLFVPRAARLRCSELVVSSEGVVRERLPEDPVCDALILYDLEGEMFFGAAPELDRYFEQLKERASQNGIHMIVLRLKRTRNPDMVCLERLQHFIEDMKAEGIMVLLCGVSRLKAASSGRSRTCQLLPQMFD